MLTRWLRSKSVSTAVALMATFVPGALLAVLLWRLFLRAEITSWLQ